jgi:hypothetical protein
MQVGSLFRLWFRFSGCGSGLSLGVVAGLSPVGFVGWLISVVRLDGWSRWFVWMVGLSSWLLNPKVACSSSFSRKLFDYLTQCQCHG